MRDTSEVEEHQSRVDDAFLQSTLLPLSDHAPMRTPQQARWDDLAGQYHQQPPGECALCLPQHTLCLRLSSGETERRSVDSPLRRGQSHAATSSLYPAGSPQWIRWFAPMEFVLLSLPVRLMKRAVPSASTDIELVADDAEITDPLLFQLGVTIWHEVAAGREESESLYLDALTLALAAHLAHRYAVARIPRERRVHTLPSGTLRVVLARLHDDLGMAPTQQELASLAGLSPYHFARSFRATTGLAPHQYLLAARLQRAKELLRQPGLTMAEIAAQVGFADQSHFAHAFKRALGMTPSAYRRGLDLSLRGREKVTGVDGVKE